MNRSLALASLLMVFPMLAPASADQAEESRRLTETAGGFSFVPPETWQARAVPGLKYKIAFGPVQDGFASNINVVDEAFTGALDAYVNANKAALERALKKVRIVKQEAFRTTAGLPGARLIVECEQNDKPLRQTFYFFGTAGMKFVVTCSTTAAGGEKLDPVFERAMKTFRLEKP